MIRQLAAVPFLLALLISYASQLQAQCIVTVQPGPDNGQDASTMSYIRCQNSNGNPRPCDTTNFGDQEFLNLGAWTVGGIAETRRFYLRFDLDMLGRMDCSPNQATLDLYFVPNSSNDPHTVQGELPIYRDNSFKLVRLTQPWNEDTISWDNSPGTGGRSKSPRATQLRRGDIDAVSVARPLTNNQDYSLNMTDMVEFWVQNPDSNFGVVAILDDELPYSRVIFGSSNNSDASKRPRLTIDFPNTCTFSAGKDSSVCLGDSLRLRPRGADKYTWTPLDVDNDPLSDNNIYNPWLKPTKKQRFRVEGTLGTCPDVKQDEIEIDIISPNPAQIVQSDTFICEGDSLLLVAQGGNLFSWSPTQGINDPTNDSIYVKPTRESVYEVEVRTAGTGETCPGKESIIVDVTPFVVANAGVDTSLCRGDTINLRAIGGNTFLWLPTESLDNASINNPKAFPSQTTTYQFIGSIRGQCGDTDSVTVTVVDPSSLVATPSDTTICQGEAVDLSVTGANSYTWTPGESLSDETAANPTARPTRSTDYIVTSNDGSNECAATDTVKITVLARPTLTANFRDTVICKGREVTLKLGGADSYTWSNGNTGDEGVIKVSEDITIMIVGKEGECESGDTPINIVARDCDGDIVDVPAFFSPNGDNINDFWEIARLEDYAENELVVFNKWGDVVFKGKPYRNNWDGLYNGQQLTEDTYMYVLKINVDGAGDEVLTGTVTILR